LSSGRRKRPASQHKESSLFIRTFSFSTLSFLFPLCCLSPLGPWSRSKDDGPALHGRRAIRREKICLIEKLIVSSFFLFPRFPTSFFPSFPYYLSPMRLHCVRGGERFNESERSSQSSLPIRLPSPPPPSLFFPFLFPWSQDEAFTVAALADPFFRRHSPSLISLFGSHPSCPVHFSFDGVEYKVDPKRLDTGVVFVRFDPHIPPLLLSFPPLFSLFPLPQLTFKATTQQKGPKAGAFPLLLPRHGIFPLFLLFSPSPPHPH